MKLDLDIPDHMELLLLAVISKLGSRPECFIHSGTDFTSLKVTWSSSKTKAKAKTATKRKKRRGGEISRSPNPVPAPDVAAEPMEVTGEAVRTPPAAAPVASDAQAPPKEKRKKKSPSRYARDSRRYREWRQRPRRGPQPRETVSDPPGLLAEPDPPAQLPRDDPPAPGPSPSSAVLVEDTTDITSSADEEEEEPDCWPNGITRGDLLYRIQKPEPRGEIHCNICNTESHKWIVALWRELDTEDKGEFAAVLSCGHIAVYDFIMDKDYFVETFINSRRSRDLTQTDRTWAINYYEELCDAIQADGPLAGK